VARIIAAAAAAVTVTQIDRPSMPSGQATANTIPGASGKQNSNRNPRNGDIK
jgi:hypothetical protein